MQFLYFKTHSFPIHHQICRFLVRRATRVSYMKNKLYHLRLDKNTLQVITRKAIQYMSCVPGHESTIIETYEGPITPGSSDTIHRHMRL